PSSVTRSLHDALPIFGLEVEQISVPADQVASKALRMASSDSLPDILELDGSELPQFAETDGLRPLDELGVDMSGFSDGAVAMGSDRKSTRLNSSHVKS